MKGIGASPGIAIGKAVVVEKKQPRLTGVILQGESDVQQEVQRFEQAVTSAVAEVKAVIDTLPADDGSTEVLEIQIELLQDEQIISDVVEKITSEHRNANDAVMEVIAAAVTTLHNLDDAYLRERAMDVEEAGNRILMELDPTLKPSDLIVAENTVLVGEDITPMDILSVDITKVIGLVTRTGGKTSHAAIVAKARGIPAVVGCGDALASVKNNDILIVDGGEGALVVNPTPEMLHEYTAKKKEFTSQANALGALKDTVAVTTDGVRVKLMANISNAADLEASFAFGAEGSGLLRTELLFMGRTTLPSEEEQFEFYKNAALQAKQKPVIVRTLDIGGDKPLPYLHLPAEQNPFLGYRAIRICLDRQDIFVTQLRAILRASAFGDLKIMFPMISNVSEIEQAKAILENVKAALRSTATPFNAAIEVGIMIEIPSAAVMADLLAREVDFFSIGTNDLCQYTLAVDRMNEQVKHLYDPFNPGVLRLIQNVIEQGNKHHHHMGMCGEMAGDVTATLLLLGMGLREFSMSAASIPYVKNLILNTSITAAQEICRKAMSMRSASEITQYLQAVTKQ
ncbi:phosphoenolpyruvate--protein phosphotransferase [Chryseolinea soli]|uniref:Phosphoenolpyruvate-protein phosphotransferase n=1 Tax=Chryseolinea soli TaxID=2321403 RepID=A0A385SGA7_9BACT|nr:phosphoenolpyruvate--protein phosphotransferase [Chryseolinea soli]AYB29912.1 phosphoenolpyruvate--protein phosphotransferase [Chryseolinea soli]